MPCIGVIMKNILRSLSVNLRDIGLLKEAAEIDDLNNGDESEQECAMCGADTFDAQSGECNNDLCPGNNPDA